MSPLHAAEGGLSLVDRNPLAVRAAVTAAVTGVVHVLVVLGVFGIDADAETAIGGAVDAVGVAVLLVWSMRSVTPNAKVISQVTTAGEVVAGDAAVVPTGTELDVVSGIGGAPAVVGTPVKAELVAPDDTA